MCVFNTKAADIARFTCSNCDTTRDHLCLQIDGRRPDTAELYDQMRVFGWGFTGHLWGPQARSYCPDCLSAAIERALTPLKPTESLTELLSEQGGIF
jgi:hypothetical protein